MTPGRFVGNVRGTIRENRRTMYERAAFPPSLPRAKQMTRTAPVSIPLVMHPLAKLADMHPEVCASPRKHGL